MWIFPLVSIYFRVSSGTHGVPEIFDPPKFKACESGNSSACHDLRTDFRRACPRCTRNLFVEERVRNINEDVIAGAIQLNFELYGDLDIDCPFVGGSSEPMISGSPAGPKPDFVHIVESDAPGSDSSRSGGPIDLAFKIIRENPGGPFWADFFAGPPLLDRTATVLSGLAFAGRISIVNSAITKFPEFFDQALSHYKSRRGLSNCFSCRRPAFSSFLESVAAFMSPNRYGNSISSVVHAAASQKSQTPNSGALSVVARLLEELATFAGSLELDGVIAKTVTFSVPHELGIFRELSREEYHNQIAQAVRLLAAKDWVPRSEEPRNPLASISGKYFRAIADLNIEGVRLFLRTWAGKMNEKLLVAMSGLPEVSADAVHRWWATVASPLDQEKQLIAGGFVTLSPHFYRISLHGHEAVQTGFFRSLYSTDVKQANAAAQAARVAKELAPGSAASTAASDYATSTAESVMLEIVRHFRRVSEVRVAAEALHETVRGLAADPVMGVVIAQRISAREPRISLRLKSLAQDPTVDIKEVFNTLPEFIDRVARAAAGQDFSEIKTQMRLAVWKSLEWDYLRLHVLPRDCGICLNHESTEIGAKTPCGHLFHNKCLLDSMRSQNRACPYCRAFLPNPHGFLL